jgi:hypothetical protein
MGGGNKKKRGHGGQMSGEREKTSRGHGGYFTHKKQKYQSEKSRKMLKMLAFFFAR